jgi:toxin secretion/phage lysis holin
MYDISLRTIVDSLISIIGSIFTFIFGGWDIALKVLIVLMIVDYLSGLNVGRKQHKINSHTSYNGLKRKLYIMYMLILAVMLDRILGFHVVYFRSLVCYFYITNESISILENCGKAGLPLPQRLMNILEQLKK